MKIEYVSLIENIVESLELSYSSNWPNNSPMSVSNIGFVLQVIPISFEFMNLYELWLGTSEELLNCCYGLCIARELDSQKMINLDENRIRSVYRRDWKWTLNHNEKKSFPTSIECVRNIPQTVSTIQWRNILLPKKLRRDLILLAASMINSVGWRIRDSLNHSRSISMTNCTDYCIFFSIAHPLFLSLLYFLLIFIFEQIEPKSACNHRPRR